LDIHFTLCSEKKILFDSVTKRIEEMVFIGGEIVAWTDERSDGVGKFCGVEVQVQVHLLQSAGAALRAFERPYHRYRSVDCQPQEE
jgi:hypothetical protein